MFGFFNAVKKFNTFKKSKKSSTLAGSLVFFTVLGIVPTAYVLSLIFTMFGKELSFAFNLFEMGRFNEIKTFLLDATEKFSSGGGVIICLIALYSSANLFVHLKLTGEFIYNYKPSKALVLRVISILGTIILSLTIVVGIILYAFFSQRITLLFGKILGGAINLVILFSISLFTTVFINLFTCPYKLRVSEVIRGSLYSCVFSVVFTVVFVLYVKYFASYDKVYGKISVIPVFLGWLFIVMRCLVNGFIINAYSIGIFKRSKKVDFKPLI